MAKKNKKRNKEVTLSRENTLSALKKIHLSGAIGECLLVLEKGKVTCEVVDITNSIVVIEKTSVGSKKLSGRFGLGNIEVFIKFLASVPDNKLYVKTSDSGRMIVQGKDKRRTLDYLTTLPNLIATRLRMDSNDDKDYAKEFRSLTEVTITIPPDFIKDFNSYLSVLKSKIATISVNEDGCQFTLGANTEHQFRIAIPEEYIDNDEEDEIEVQTNGENLSKVFSVMEMAEDESPTLSIGDGSPVILEDDTTLWALTPYSDESMEE